MLIDKHEIWKFISGNNGLIGRVIATKMTRTDNEYYYDRVSRDVDINNLPLIYEWDL